MSIKAARGTKRLCENCENKYYDLNRDPIVCPICETVFEVKGAISAVDHIAESDDEADEIIDAPAGAEIVSLDEVDESSDDGVPAIEDEENLADIDDDADIPDATDDDTFLEEEDDDPDVSGIIGAPLAPGNDET